MKRAYSSSSLNSDHSESNRSSVSSSTEKSHHTNSSGSSKTNSSISCGSQIFEEYTPPSNPVIQEFLSKYPDVASDPNDWQKEARQPYVVDFQPGARIPGGNSLNVHVDTPAATIYLRMMNKGLEIMLEQTNIYGSMRYHIASCL